MQKLACYAIPRNFVIDGNGRIFKFEAPLSFINEGKDLVETLNSAVATLE